MGRATTLIWQRPNGRASHQTTVALALQGQAETAQQHIDIALRRDKVKLCADIVYSAQAIAQGDAKYLGDIQKLAQRLFKDRAAPMGGSMLDLILPNQRSN